MPTANTIKKLSPHENRKPFDCGDTDLNDFFLNDSAGHALQLLSVTYVLEDNKETIAFFSVLNDRIQKDDRTKGAFRRIRKTLPPGKHYGSYPAVKVGRFGVDKSHQRLKTGTDVMNYIKILFVDKQQKTGCRFITVDAYNNDCVIMFYEKNGFKFRRAKHFTIISSRTLF